MVLPMSKTINSDLYCKQLMRLKQEVEKKRLKLINRKGVSDARALYRRVLGRYGFSVFRIRAPAPAETNGVGIDAMRVNGVHAPADNEKQRKREERLCDFSPLPDDTRRQARHCSQSTRRSGHPHCFSSHKKVADQNFKTLP
ncbi:hypothetical protein EVAR_99693_1 [Eumeta japonica]|uniref:Uncharacterized protein n=1 Tax=Eumeta variegata TaxID=151549 RepID=A0A4C1YFN4_EUMVA|nr:hypothetical protein EVAR_99693_1 [Eumeta japonica]